MIMITAQDKIRTHNTRSRDASKRVQRKPTPVKI